MIDLTKFDTKTRDGTPVRNLTITRGKYRLIGGERLIQEGKTWRRTLWSMDGKFNPHLNCHALDLVIREEKKPLSWTKEKPTEPLR